VAAIFLSLRWLQSGLTALTTLARKLFVTVKITDRDRNGFVDLARLTQSRRLA
jgi:hypothetical protein